MAWLARLGLLPTHPSQWQALEEIAAGGLLSPAELSGFARECHTKYRLTGMLGPVVHPRLLCTAMKRLLVPTETAVPSARYREDLECWVISLPEQGSTTQMSFATLHELSETLVGRRGHPDVQTLVPLLAIEKATVNLALTSTGSVQRAIRHLQREHAHLPGWIVALSTVWHGAEPE